MGWHSAFEPAPVAPYPPIDGLKSPNSARTIVLKRGRPAIKQNS